MCLFCYLSKLPASSIVLFLVLFPAWDFGISSSPALPSQSDQIWTIHLFQILCYAIITICTQHYHFKCKLQKLPFQSTVQFCLRCKSALSSFPQNTFPKSSPPHSLCRLQHYLLETTSETLLGSVF